MHIVWMLTEEGYAAHAAGAGFTLASNRYRVALPMIELVARQHRVSLCGLGPGEASVEDAIALGRGADVVVFAKNHAAPAAVQRVATELRRARVPIVIDICDDCFENDHPYAAHYRGLLAAADGVTASCAALADRVSPCTSALVTVIEDPFEGPRGEPRWASKPRMNALWFGGVGNLPSLMKEVDELPRKVCGYALDMTVLTGPVPGIESAFKQYNARHRSRITLRHVPWSLSGNWTALAACDLVLIPVARDVRYFLAKGPNRIVEALWAGRMVFAHPIRSYEAFGAWAWVGDDLASGIAWALAHPQLVIDRIAAGQAYIAARYSRGAIADSWVAALADVRKRAGRTAVN